MCELRENSLIKSLEYPIMKLYFYVLMLITFNVQQAFSEPDREFYSAADLDSDSRQNECVHKVVCRLRQ